MNPIDARTLEHAIRRLIDVIHKYECTPITGNPMPQKRAKQEYDAAHENLTGLVAALVLAEREANAATVEATPVETCEYMFGGRGEDATATLASAASRIRARG